MAFGKKSARTVPLPPGWWRIRKQVLQRDGGVCQHVRADTGLICGAPATDVDHMGEPDDHRLHMLRALCRFHHSRVTGSQGGRAVRRGKKQVWHPGLKSG